MKKIKIRKFKVGDLIRFKSGTYGIIKGEIALIVQRECQAAWSSTYTKVVIQGRGALLVNDIWFNEKTAKLLSKK